MEWKFLFLILILLESSEGSSPCDDGNHYYLHKGGWRGTECSRTVSDSICDRYIFSNTWYKVIGHDDSEPRKIAVGPVDMFKCGTDYPLYLVNETHPTVDGAVVTTNVCMRDGQNPCVNQYEIQIMKCESFYVYNLTRPETCDIAYCFGERMPCSKPDPCDSDNHVILPVTEDRSTSCQNEDIQLCDSELKTAWYRPLFQNIDVRMPTSCVDQNSCGTRSPIWLNGKEPTLNDKSVSMKACVTSGYQANCSCSREIDIQVRNCSKFLVYNLTATPTCPGRFCFGNTGECKKSEEENNEKTENSRSIWEEPSNIIYICLAAAIVLVFLVLLTCIIYKKHILNVRIVSQTEKKPSMKKIDQI